MPSRDQHASLRWLDEMLVDCMDLREQDARGRTALHRAVQVALGDVVGEEPLVEELDEHTPSSSELACRLDSILRRHCPDPALVANSLSLHDDSGFMPIHHAVVKSAVPVCEVLLKHGAAVNAYTLRTDVRIPTRNCGPRMFGGRVRRHDETALHLAICSLADARRYDGQPVAEVDLALVKLLLKHGADMNAHNCRGQTSLHAAVSGGLQDVVTLLLSQANVDLSESCGNHTCMHLAVIRKDLQMVQLLVQHGAPVNVRGKSGLGGGWTPLCLAAREGNVCVAKALIAARANLHATSSNGKTALEIASINRQRMQACQTVYEMLHLEMVASVLDIALTRPVCAARQPTICDPHDKRALVDTLPKNTKHC